ncbi:MAG: helix-turn-helix domain-containing protein [Candidatus Micrarchaeia archaeon]
MAKEDPNEILQALLRIEHRLEDMGALLRLGQRGQIEQIKQEFLSSGVRKSVYELCNGNCSVNEMAAKLHKKGPNISRALGELEAAGLIRQIRAGRHVSYERLI